MFKKHYANYYEIFHQDKPYKKEIEFVYKWAEKPQLILDIGAGNAAYWKYWPEGVRVFGIEKSADMIACSPYKQRIYQLDAAFISELDFFQEDFELVTALFNVINYVPHQLWWKDIPLKSGGYFIFDVYDKIKADKDGFKQTEKKVGNISRIVTPSNYDGKSVDLKIEINDEGVILNEEHKMFLYSPEEIRAFCGQSFEIVEVKPTKNWQTWYKLRKK